MAARRRDHARKRVSPDHGYTAHVVSEQRVGEEGWTGRDASFGGSITRDQVLHGTWGGAAGKPASADRS